jgi:hypothetical protein
VRSRHRAWQHPAVITDFVPGAELSRRLYADAVRPLLTRHFPTVVHSAALIGHGSEVLGLDTVRSTDHDWGPRLQLFLTPADLAAHRGAIDDLLATALPPAIAGYPTNLVPFTEPAAAAERGTRQMRPVTGRIRHGVVIAGLDDWLAGHLGFGPSAGVTTMDWLATPTQTLAEVTGGAVHHDGLGRLGPIRETLAWYPDDIWRYVLACQWQRVGQEEPFVGRCGEVGDELGSAVVAARLVRDLMRLSLLIDRVYPPYSKWLGSAFARSGAPEAGAMRAALAATGWHDRERHLVAVYESVAARQNALGLTAPVDPRVRPFFDRPFRVLGAERFTAALMSGIADPALAGRPPTGAIDQFADSTDVLAHRERSRAIAAALART